MIVEATARMTQSAAIMLFCLTDGGDTQMTLLKKKKKKDLFLSFSKAITGVLFSPNTLLSE